MKFFKRNNYQQRVLFFRQWRNKSYASFISIGRVVHIGNLSVSLAEWIGKVVDFIEETFHACQDKESEEVESDLLDIEDSQGISIVVGLKLKNCGCYGFVDFVKRIIRFLNNKISIYKSLIAANWRLSPVSGFFFRS